MASNFSNMVKTRVQNYRDSGLPTIIGIGIVFAVVASRRADPTVAHWLGLGLSLGLIALGFIFGIQRKSLMFWSRILTAFGFVYMLYSIDIGDWQKAGEALAAIVVGMILTPDKKYEIKY